jgi:hypothetical protein
MNMPDYRIYTDAQDMDYFAAVDAYLAAFRVAMATQLVGVTFAGMDDASQPILLTGVGAIPVAPDQAGYTLPSTFGPQMDAWAERVRVWSETYVQPIVGPAFSAIMSEFGLP